MTKLKAFFSFFHFKQNLNKRSTAVFLLCLELFACIGGAAALSAGITGCSFGTVDEGIEVNAADSGTFEEEIAEKVIRFHVIGNSNGEEDQRIKLAVKEAVTGYLKPLLEDVQEVSQAKAILAEQMEQILSAAGSVLAQEGARYGCSAEITKCYFPLKIYGDIALPPGEYEALRIVLGEGKGKNWWCIMFPPLCFVDAACGVVPEESKETLKGLLTEDEYGMILQNNVELKPRLKIVEFFKELFS